MLSPDSIQQDLPPSLSNITKTEQEQLEKTLAESSITPTPGFVIKTRILESPSVPSTTDSSLLESTESTPKDSNFLPTGLKIFINVCHSDLIPAPPPSTTKQIHAALSSSDNTSYSVPLSLLGPFQTIDKSGQEAGVFSACVHSSVIDKCNEDPDFKEFIIELVFEWIESRTGVNLDRKFSTPKLKAKGEMVTHYVKKKPKHGISVVGVETPVYSLSEGRIVVSMPRMANSRGCKVDVDDGGIVVECKGVYLLEVRGDFKKVEEGVFDLGKRELIIEYAGK